MSLIRRPQRQVTAHQHTYSSVRRGGKIVGWQCQRCPSFVKSTRHRRSSKSFTWVS